MNPDECVILGENSAEMPQYVSHKKVWALELAAADRLTCRLSFVEIGYAGITVPAEMWSRYQPVPGDFYVVYADGYKSFSPRKAFLEGYVRIGTISEISSKLDDAIVQELSDRPKDIMG